MTSRVRSAEIWPHVKLVASGCWEWQRSRDRGGYGRVRSLLAHRLAFASVYGPIPGGLCVLHSGDNPCCCRPSHLFLGTRADNNADRAAKGRTGANIGANMRRYPERRPRGERQGSAKLTVDAVRRIRELTAKGMTHRAMAQLFGVSRTTIGEIVRRENWAHV